MSAGLQAKVKAKVKAKAKPKVLAKNNAKPKARPAAKTKVASKSTSRPKLKRKAARRALDVGIQVQSALWTAQPQAERTVRAAIAAAGIHSTSDGEVSILLTDDSAVRTLNRDWRGIDKPTNVLSFPAPELPANGGARILGDIVIAYETLQRECTDEDRAFLHHLTHLTVHGFLHLLGYDHRTDAEADAMEAIESKIMTGMKLPDPWLDRGGAHDRSRKRGGA